LTIIAMTHNKMRLSPREVSLLVSIRAGGKTRKVIAQEVVASPPELTRLVKSLQSKGFVTVQRHGMSTSVSFSETKHATRLRMALNEFNHMKLEGILSLASLDVLSALAARTCATRKDTVSSSGISARTLHTALKRLQEVGIVRRRSRGVYEISDRFEPLADFAREFDEYSNHRMAVEFSPDSLIVWQRGKEFIVRARGGEEGDDYRKTAFSEFEHHRVPLFMDWHYYYHPAGGWRRTIDEVLLQSLLIRHRGTRENTAILMLWERNGLGRNIDRLRVRAKEYGVEQELEAIAAYFEDPEKNRPPGFPRITELKEKLGSRG